MTWRAGTPAPGTRLDHAARHLGLAGGDTAAERQKSVERRKVNTLMKKRYCAKRPILSLRPRLTLKPKFVAYLDKALKQAEAGNTIRFENEADECAYLTGAAELIARHEPSLRRGDHVRLTGLSKAELRRTLWGEE